MRKLINLFINMVRFLTYNFWTFFGSLIKLVIIFLVVIITAPFFFGLYNIPFTGFEVDFGLII